LEDDFAGGSDSEFRGSPSHSANRDG